jgi:hypothetical protein
MTPSELAIIAAQIDDLCERTLPDDESRFLASIYHRAVDRLTPEQVARVKEIYGRIEK